RIRALEQETWDLDVENNQNNDLKARYDISKKARILELKRRNMKITVLTTNTPYPSWNIQCICACTSQNTMKETRSIRRIQGRPIRGIQAMEIKYSGRYRTWKHFKTLSLDESRSPDFDLFSNQEESSEEEVAETMAETMEHYMSKTQANYGSGIARPKINDKDSFQLKGTYGIT
ncbi:hypothetical protein Tco_1021695, partial [Tanacetum coccineum]